MHRSDEEEEEEGLDDDAPLEQGHIFTTDWHDLRKNKKKKQKKKQNFKVEETAEAEAEAEREDGGGGGGVVCSTDRVEIHEKINK